MVSKWFWSSIFNCEMKEIRLVYWSQDWHAVSKLAGTNWFPSCFPSLKRCNLQSTIEVIFFFPLSFVSLWELNLICVFVCLFFKKNLIWKAEPSYSLEEAKGKWHKLIMMLIANYISTHSLYLVDNSCCLLQWAVSQTLHSCFKAFETAYVHCRNHYLNVERVGTVEIWTASFANGLGGKNTVTGISNEILKYSTVHILFLLNLTYEHFRTVSYSLWNVCSFTHAIATTFLHGVGSLWCLCTMKRGFLRWLLGSLGLLHCATCLFCCEFSARLCLHESSAGSHRIIWAVPDLLMFKTFYHWWKFYPESVRWFKSQALK